MPSPAPARPATVLMPLPAADFDPSEAAISWQAITNAGHRVVFATPEGRPAAADPLMVTGEGLDLWGFVPGLRKLKLVGLALRANGDARLAYAAMLEDAAYRAPHRWDDLGADGPSGVRVAQLDGLLLPGGHRAQGMRAYLEDPRVQGFVAACFDADLPVGAICHGVVLAARATSARSGRSVLHGRRTTALTWALERKAFDTSRFAGRFWDPGYYRTYREQPGEPAGHRSVQAEVTRALARPEDFLDVPADAPDHFRKASGLFRDSARDARPAFVVRDGRYVSARWPGDVHAFAQAFCELLAQRTTNAH